MVPPTEGPEFVTDFRDSTLLRLALTATLVAALALAGCGRKGPLDPPPGASLEGVTQANMPGLMSTSGPPKNIGGQPTDNPELGPDGHPLKPAAKGANKPIPLDGLLN